MKRHFKYLFVTLILLTACSQSEDFPHDEEEGGAKIESELRPTSPSQFSKESIDPGQHQAFSFISNSGEEIEYFLSLPKDYKENQEWPIMLYLHSFLGFNYDLDKLLSLSPLSWLDPDVDFPFVIIIPMGPDGQWSEYFDPLEELIAFLNESLSIDEDAVFITGASAGGTGVWQWILEFPDRFVGAAVVTSSPSFRTDDSIPENICLIKDLPLWVAYTTEDPDSLNKPTIATVDALKECGSTIVQLTIYSDLIHMEAIRKAYEGPDLYEWMLEQIQE